MALRRRAVAYRSVPKRKSDFCMKIAIFHEKLILCKNAENHKNHENDENDLPKPQYSIGNTWYFGIERNLDEFHRISYIFT